MQQHAVQTYEHVALYPDGASHDVIVTKATFCAPNGAVAGMVGTLQDITEAKRSELLLRNGEWLQGQFMDALPVGVCVLDAQAQLFYMNQVAQRLLGAGQAPAGDIAHFVTAFHAYLLGTNQISD
jgi:PAS domain-containing protein